MNNKKQEQSDAKRAAAWQGLALVLVAALTLEATSLIQYYFSRKGIEEETLALAQSELESTGLRITGVMDQVETVLQNNVWTVRECLTRPDSLKATAIRVVEDNPVIIGSTVAMVPGYLRRYPLYAPYAVREADTLRVTSLATADYDYPSQPWFTKPIESDEGYWSEPYWDEGGGNVLMTTFSLPIRDKKGRLAAVLTADVSLDWMSEIIGDIDVYPHAYGVMLSREGQIMASPAETLVMQTSMREIATRFDDSVSVSDLARSMQDGQTGSTSIHNKKKVSHVFYAPVKRAGWSMCIVVPHEEIYGNIERIGKIVLLLQVLGILMIILIITATVLSQMHMREIADRKNRIENELQVARGIQMAMIPKIFPPYPERGDIDMFASLTPAKEVGGDLYDFYIRDDKLFFCIGDVSGKGVPASLVMAVTRSLFRTVSGHENSPQRIVSTMNSSMSESNETSMFVTLFVGVLDLLNGHLRYCNAGHNAPLLLSGDTAVPLEVASNIALGILPDQSFCEQETDLKYGEGLFLYTDGLTEAENESHQLFGESRMMREAARNTGLPVREQVERMQARISEHVGSAPQSDDLTMLVIKYMNTKEPDAAERHLILHNDIQQIPQLASFIEQIADESGIDQSLAMSLNLALEEAVTNVICYAYPEGSDGLVDIEAIIRHDRLDFIVSDSGTPFDPTEVAQADVSLDVNERPIGGLGVFLIRNIMNEVRYERKDGKNILYMTKKL